MIKNLSNILNKLRIALLIIAILIPVQSYAITEEEAENNALEYALKLQGINTPSHKNLWMEMKRIRGERDNLNYKGEKNLIKYLIQKNNLDPINKSDDQCRLMEMMVGYIVGGKYFGGASNYCADNSGCAKHYSILVQEKFDSLLKYGEGDGEGSYQDLYIVTDNYSRPIGVWSSFDKQFSIKKGVYKIGQGYKEEGYNHLSYLIPQQKDSNVKDNISYIKINNCYIKEIHMKLDTVYIQPDYIKNYKH